MTKQGKKKYQQQYYLTVTKPKRYKERSKELKNNSFPVPKYQIYTTIWIENIINK